MNTKSIFDTQAEFLTAGDVTFPAHDIPATQLATSLIQEEFNEWQEESPYAITKNKNDLKECIDLMYVCAQYLNQAVGPEKAQLLFDAVHKNNMDKCIEGKLVRSPEGKILKPDGFDKLGYLPEFNKVLGH